MPAVGIEVPCVLASFPPVSDCHVIALLVRFLAIAEELGREVV